MAASMRFGMLLLNSSIKVQVSVCKDWKSLTRVLPQLDQVRSLRSSAATRSGLPPKRAPRRQKTLEDQTSIHQLTGENREFLDEVILDKFPVRTSPLKEPPWERKEWTFRPVTRRTGVLAVKLGVIPQWTKSGRKILVTMLQVLDNHVIDYIPPEVCQATDKVKPYWRGKLGISIVGALSCAPHQYVESYVAACTNAGVAPKRKVTRFYVSPNAAVQPGTPLYATHFRVGDYVDCFARTIGHGFQGVVKRWGMKGGPASHGATKHHRKMGSSGGGRKKAGRWKGKKMPGHMGFRWRKLQGLKIVRMNTKYNILYVKGGNIPGPTHCYVRIQDCLFGHRIMERKNNPPPMPTSFPQDSSEPLPEELFDEDLFEFTSDTITFDEKTKTT